MSETKDQATQLWTQFVEAMRADGIIAAVITQCGPATTHIIMQTCEAITSLRDKPVSMPWLNERIKPESGRVVLVQDDLTGSFRVGHWNDNTQMWRSAETGDELDIAQWRYIEPPAVTVIAQPDALP